MSAPVDATYRCPRAAVWLPRALAAAVLLATAVATFETAPRTGHAMATALRALITAAGVVGALWLLRSGSEVRTAFRLEGDDLVCLGRRGSRRIPLDRFVEVDFAPALSTRGSWLPAVVLLDRRGGLWRVPALLEDGGRFIDELLARSGRSDLAAWAEARSVGRRMARTRLRLVVGYGIAVGLATWAAVIGLRR